MTLSRKILVWLFGTLAVLVPLILFVSSWIVLNGFNRADRTAAVRSLERLVEVISAEADALEVVAIDWGAWNDTFDYVQDRNREFERANLADTSIGNLRVDVMMFADAKGDVVFGTGFDRIEGVSKALPEGLKSYLKRADGRFSAINVDSETSGILMLPEGPLLVGAHSITRTDGTGPARGVVLFGRWLDSRMIGRVESILRFPVSISPLIGRTETSRRFQEARAAFANNAPNHVEILDGERLAAFTTLRDIHGRPALMARIEMPREVYREGRASLVNLGVSLLVFTLVISFVVLVSMRRLVLDRVAALMDGVGRVRSQADLGARLPARGNDELTRLTHAINQMLESLERSEEHQVRVDAALALEKERLAVTLRSIGEGVMATDVTGQIVLINTSAEAMTGWPSRDALGQPMWKIFRAVDSNAGQPLREIMSDVFTAGRSSELPAGSLLVSRNGLELGVAGNVAPVINPAGQIVGAVLVFRDTTDAQRIEDERMKANKLESVGLLAGGIAHDFNNALTAILSNNMLATLCAGSDPELRGYLADTERSCLHARSLTQQLLTFARGGAPVKKPADVGALLHEAGSFAVRGTNVRCHFDIARGLLPAEVDEGQIVQVVQNLVINAVQAMPSGGNVHISASNLEAETQSAAPRLLITVRDEGTGIAPENLSKIFDPYFTTKRRGTGLGLATAYSIVRNHGGTISVESTLDVGTTFTINLPALPAAEGLPALHPVERWTGPCRILLMDDDEIILNAIESVLTKLGCTVKTTPDGQSAVDAYSAALRSGQPYDAVIMDLTVPAGMGGLEAAGKIRAMDPKARLVVSSGYSNDPVMADHEKYGFTAVLPKPFTISDLTSVLHAVAPRRDPDQSSKMT